MSLTRVLSIALCAAALCAAPPHASAQTRPGTSAPPADGPPAPSPTPKPKAIPRKVVPGAPAGWERYEFGEPRLFAIALPSKHEAETEFVALGGAQPSSAHTYSGETDDGNYIALVMENLPFDAARMPEKLKQDFYDGVWAGMVAGIKKDMEQNGVLLTLDPGTSKSAKVSGIDGREQEFKLGLLQGRARMVLSGSRIFLVLLMEDADAGLSPAGLAFLNSLEVYPPPR